MSWLDALGWASASTKAPANLTLTQLRGIYNCTFTDWSDDRAGFLEADSVAHCGTSMAGSFLRPRTPRYR